MVALGVYLADLVPVCFDCPQVVGFDVRKLDLRDIYDLIGFSCVGQ